MAVLPILIAPHPTLKRRAEPVQEVDAEIRQLTEDMLETMYDAPGVGLGEFKRRFRNLAADTTESDYRKALVDVTRAYALETTATNGQAAD